MGWKHDKPNYDVERLTKAVDDGFDAAKLGDHKGDSTPKVLSAVEAARKCGLLPKNADTLTVRCFTRQVEGKDLPVVVLV